MLPLVSRTDSRVIVHLPAGKPDPSAPPPRVGHADCRLRVPQKPPRQDDRPWYYALNYIRPRIGKHISAEKTPERTFERAASALRKASNSALKSLPAVCRQLNDESTRAKLATITHDKAASLSSRTDLYNMLPSDLKSLFLTFCGDEKSEHLLSFLEALVLHATTESDEAFLRPVSTDSEVLQHIRMRQGPAQPGQKKGDEPLWAYQTWLDQRVIAACIRGYGLGLSSWDPSQPIDHLFYRLQFEGPLVVTGWAHATAYVEPPTVLLDAAVGARVFAWPPGAQLKAPAERRSHAIVLVGVEQTADEQYVYFVDPHGEPNGALARPIYRLPYLVLRENLCDLNGHLTHRTGLPSFELAPFGAQRKGKRAVAEQGWAIYCPTFFTNTSS